jgi:exodeoxyribonuclease VII large subunit
LQSEQRLHDAMPRMLERTRRDADQRALRLASAGEGLLHPFESQVGRAAASLDALSPLRVLSRGYAIAQDERGHVVSSAADVEVGQRVCVRLGSGSFGAEVTSVDVGND